MTVTMPTNHETERALLHALLQEPVRASKMCWAKGLVADDFHRPQHAVMYATICDRLRRGDDVDEITLIDELRRREHVVANRPVNALSFVGGEAAIMGLPTSIGLVSLAGDYAAELVSQANSRELVLAGEELAKQGSDLAPVADVVTSIERRLARVRDRAEGRHDGSRKSDVGEVLQGFIHDYISDEPDDVIPFDLPSLNAIGGGMFPGDVVVVGARSGVGKSWTGLSLLERSVNEDRRVALFSIEMPAQQMVRRLVAMGGHNLTGIRKRALPYEQIDERVTQIGTWSGRLDIFDGSTNVDRVQAVLAGARIEGKPYRLAIIDHIHLLSIPGRDYRLGLNAELTRLKHIAVEHGVTLVLLAQLSRPQKTDDANKVPTKHDLRESGGLGDIADYVLLLHRDVDEDGTAGNHGSVIVDKVRDGAGTGAIDVMFDTRTYRFVEGGFMAGTRNGRVA